MDILKEIRVLLDKKQIPSSEYRQRLRFESLRFLATEKNFDIGDHLGEGSYGEVYAAKSSNYDTSVAVKIVCSEDVWIGEFALWPTLDHKNVLPLLDLIRVPYACLFVTPLLFKDMETLLEDENFIYSQRALNIAKTWLIGILDALDYLHTKNMCHLDLKADNVLIDYDFKAVLCDFSFINYAGECTERYGVPIPYRPPDTCLAFEKEILVDAVPFEMWSYGILALNVLTGHYFKNRLPLGVKYWHKDIYPLLFEAMQMTTFRIFMVKAFPLSNTAEEFTNAFNFIQYILRLQPKDRPSVGMTHQHMFLKEGGHVLEKPDDIWLSYDISSCFCECMKPVKYIKQYKDNYDLFKFRKSSKRPFLGYKKRRLWEKPSKYKKTDEKTVSNTSPYIIVGCNNETSRKHNEDSFKRSIFVQSAFLNRTPDHALFGRNPPESNSVAKGEFSDECCKLLATGDATKSSNDCSYNFDELQTITMKDTKIKNEAVRKSPEERMISNAKVETKQTDVNTDAATRVKSSQDFCKSKNSNQDEKILRRTEIAENSSLKNSSSTSVPTHNSFESNITEKEENSVFRQKFEIIEDATFKYRNDSSNTKEFQANTMDGLTNHVKYDALSEINIINKEENSVFRQTFETAEDAIVTRKNDSSNTKKFQTNTMDGLTNYLKYDELSESKKSVTVSAEQTVSSDVQSELKQSSSDNDDDSVSSNTETAGKRNQKNKIRICEWFMEKLNAFYFSISKCNKDETDKETLSHM